MHMHVRTYCMLEYEYMCNLGYTIIGRRKANEVPSVFNKLAECDDTVRVATRSIESIQVSADKIPDRLFTHETDKGLQISTPYAVVTTEDVRKNTNYQYTYVP